MKKNKTALTIIALTSAQSKHLAQLEAIIETGRKTFIDVGTALAEIRDLKLYKKTHATFQAYCVEKWQFQRAQAHRVIEAAKVAAQLSPTGDIVTERSARELLKVPKEMREEVVKTATANAKAAGRTMTTKDLTDAAKTLVPTVPKAVKKKDDAVVQTGKGQDAAASTDEKTQATEPVVPPTQLPAELPAKPSSATDQLYELWLKATAVEREAFLKLINAEIVEPSLPLFEDNN